MTPSGVCGDSTLMCRSGNAERADRLDDLEGLRVCADDADDGLHGGSSL